MERYDARKETFEEIEIFDTLALFSSGRGTETAGNL